jgi:hypothetical protein
LWSQSPILANTVHEQFVNSLPNSLRKPFSHRLWQTQFMNSSWIVCQTVCESKSVTDFGKHYSWTHVLQTVCEGVHEQTGKLITLSHSFNYSPIATYHTLYASYGWRRYKLRHMPSSSLHTARRMSSSSRCHDEISPSLVQAREEPPLVANMGNLVKQGPVRALMTSKEIENNAWE